MESNPGNFAQLFGEALRRKSAWLSSSRNGDILDYIAEHPGALQMELGAGDKVRLDGYFETVREIDGAFSFPRIAISRA